MGANGSLADWLQGTVRRTGAVFATPCGVVDGSEFDDRVVRAAGVLASRNKSCVVLYHDDPCQFAAWLCACWRTGRGVLVLPDKRPGTLAAIGDGDLLRLGELPDSVAVDVPVAGRTPIGPLVMPTGPALRMYTSGSTGTPVVVDKTLAQLESELTAVDAALRAAAADTSLVAGTVSHQHYYGLIFRLLWPLAHGRTCWAPTIRFPEELRALPDDGNVVLVSSPAFLRTLAQSTESGTARSRLHLLLSAGSRLEPEYAAGVVADSGLQLCEIYGSTETGAVAMRCFPDAGYRPLPGVELSIGEDEVLDARAPYVAGTEWMRTADRARCGADGFEIVGRVDRLVKVADKRVSLDAIEAALCATGLASHARAALIPGARPVLGAVLVPSAAGNEQLARDGAYALGRALRGLLVDSFEGVVVPKRWRFVAALPENALGKTTMRELLELFENEVCDPEVLGCEATDGGVVVLRLYLDADLDCFRGHFPGMPIVSGVAQLDWVIRLARAYFGMPTEFAGIDGLKFRRVMVPGMRVTLTLQWLASESIVVFRYESGSLHSSGRVRFADGSA
jgi:3-hydroxymyristoyl/3-hydroxydecanoyl-(acyl carrier protein) dehydratase